MSAGSYTGPRGERYLKVFICHGCQTCLRMGENDDVVDMGPHYLTVPEDVTDMVVLKELSKKENEHD